MIINKAILFLVPLLVFFAALAVTVATPKGTVTRGFAMKAAVRVSCFLLGVGLHAMLEAAKFTHGMPALVGVYAGMTLIASCLTVGKKAPTRKWLRAPITYTFCGAMGFCALLLNHTEAAGIEVSLLLFLIVVIYDQETILNPFLRLIMIGRND